MTALIYFNHKYSFKTIKSPTTGSPTIDCGSFTYFKNNFDSCLADLEIILLEGITTHMISDVTNVPTITCANGTEVLDQSDCPQSSKEVSMNQKLYIF